MSVSDVRPKKQQMLVGLSGKIGSGKTTLADLLIAAAGGDGVCCNFADALKREVANEFGVPLGRCYAQEEKNRAISDTIPLTIGEALQNVGAQRRAEVPSYWLDRLGESVAELDARLVIVGDVRHTNEAEWVRERGGLLVRLNGDPGGVRAASKRDLQHRSETELDAYQHFDVTFDTNNTAADACAGVVFAMLHDRASNDAELAAFLLHCTFLAFPTTEKHEIAVSEQVPLPGE